MEKKLQRTSHSIEREGQENPKRSHRKVEEVNRKKKKRREAAKKKTIYSNPWEMPDINGMASFDWRTWALLMDPQKSWQNSVAQIFLLQSFLLVVTLFFINLQASGHLEAKLPSFHWFYTDQDTGHPDQPPTQCISVLRYSSYASELLAKEVRCQTRIR